ncbi:MAG: DUF721 domain-containing protein [Alphaproteobacteria bacterium]|nr:MAG: DUF721 domain-containing protein [Alphaproteobacteria bacterium]
MDQNEIEIYSADDSEPYPVVRRPGSYLKPASSLVPQLLQQIPGFDARLAQLLTQWGNIIGAPLNQFCAPDKIIQSRKDDPCILQLRVMGAAALEIQHQQPQIIERINSYFGHRLIHGLRLVQGYMPNKTAATAKPVMRPAKPSEIPANLNEIEQPELRESLAKLAASLD